MKHEPKVISIQRISAFRLDPTFTSEEAIVLRALVAGKIDKQVCNELRMAPESFLRMMRDLRERPAQPITCPCSYGRGDRWIAVISRIDGQERNARPA